MARKKIFLLQLLVVIGAAGCLLDLVMDPIIENHVQKSMEKRADGMTQPVPMNSWDKGASLVVISYNWNASAFRVGERNVAGGLVKGALFQGFLFTDRDDFYDDVTPEFEARLKQILSREYLQKVQAGFNARLSEHLKAKIPCPVRVVNLDLPGDMGDIFNPRKRQPGERQVHLMPMVIFYGKTPAMKVEVNWSLMMGPVASGIVRYKSEGYSPSQWLDGTGALLKQELDKATDNLALAVAQALSGSPTQPKGEN